jgi:tRNA threonylcarbamoyladenosine biosynthesis protein TsaB
MIQPFRHGEPAARTLLAIDTATDVPGVALRHGGETRARAIGWRAAFRETAPAAAALLAEAGIGWEEVGALVVPAGPGSFTGLRVGATLATGLARGRGIPLHAVPTLEAVAEAYAGEGASRGARACAVVDARRGRWYAALCEREESGWRARAGPADLAPGEIAPFAQGAPVVGPGAEAVGGSSSAPGPAPVARALVALAARSPERTRVAPGELRLHYARSGVEA